MTDPRSVVRALFVYAICLPLALVVGYMLATPLNVASFVSVGLVLLFLLFPIMLRWHHPLLIFSWNMVAVIPFVPGKPQIRLGLVGVSLLISWLMYAMDRRARPQNVPTITWPLAVLTLVIVVTAQLTGFAGFGTLGSAVGGGSRYVLLLGGILGYFALSARAVPVERANLYVGLFFLGGLTLFISSLAPITPNWLQYIYLIFPVEQSVGSTSAPTGLGMVRVYGVAHACMAGLFFMLARFGLRQIFASTKPWRVILFLALLSGVMFGGYRAYMILILGAMVIQFYLEGMFKMRFLPVWLGVAGVCVALLPLVSRLPFEMQRSLAWIPGIAAPEVALDARRSTEWRLKMWGRVVDEVPNYLLVGKGYAFDLGELEMARFRRMARGELEVGELSELAGDYHNGPLSIIIPFGIVGVVAVLWFWIASWRLLLHNYRHGPAELTTINTFLLAFFCARICHFLVVFGALHVEFFHFTGLVGLSVALNRGFARTEPVEEEVKATSPERSRLLHPALAPAAPARG